MFTNLEMMYADHVMRNVGGRTIESVPEVVRENVKKIIAESLSKPVETA